LSGRIYLMRPIDECRAQITESVVEHMFRCVDCRACEAACPSGVHFGQMMEEMRGKSVDERSAHWLSRLILNHIFPFPWRFQIASRMLQFYRISGFQCLLRTTDLLRWFSPRMAAAEALMPEIGMETGVPLDSTYRAEGKK